MKMLITIFCFLLVLAFEVQAQTSNYFDEAYKISAIVSRIKTEKNKLYKKYKADSIAKRQTAPRATIAPFKPDSVFPWLASEISKVKSTTNGDTYSQGGQNQGGQNQGGIQSGTDLSKYDSTGLYKELKTFCEMAKASIGTFDKFQLEIPAQFKFVDDIFSSLNSIQSAIGNSSDSKTGFSFSESDIIYGITDYAIKEAKAELVDVYLKRWYDTLKRNDLIKQTIPNTLGTFNAFIMTDALNLTKFGDKWKSSFEADFRNMPIILQDKNYVKEIFKTLKVEENIEIISAITGSNELIYKLYLKNNIVNIISDMAKYPSEDDLTAFQKVIVMSDIIASVSGGFDSQNNFQLVTFGNLQKMDSSSWDIFFKLLYARNKTQLTKLFPHFLTDPKWNELKVLIPQSINILYSFQNLVASHAGKDQLTFDEGRKIFDVAFQLLENAYEYFKLYKNENLATRYENNVRPYFAFIAEIGDGISSKQYGKVLDGVANVLKKIRGNSPDKNKTIENLERIGSFMLNILSAKSSDDVEAALDEMIPKNQYKLKNAKKFSISLSAIPGFYAGNEIVQKYQTNSNGAINYSLDKIKSQSFSSGFYLPVGLDFNWVSGKSKKSCTSFMLQVLDLGAVLSYRITSDSTEQSNPNFTFKQVLSPGIILSKHLPNSPVVFGAAANYSPALRTISQDGHQYDVNSFRYFFFVGVDVTFLYLHLSKK